GEAMDAAGLAARLADFCHGDIALQIPGELDLTPWQAPAATIPRLWAKPWTPPGWLRGWQTSVMAILHYRFRANWISP
ncbi:hypothetical protein C0U44_31375, partial [Klebsiella pneumoniae]